MPRSRIVREELNLSTNFAQYTPRQAGASRADEMPLDFSQIGLVFRGKTVACHADV